MGLDYFFGDPIYLHTDDPEFDRRAWFTKAWKLAEDATPGWIDAVREKYGADAKYNAVGSYSPASISFTIKNRLYRLLLRRTLCS